MARALLAGEIRDGEEVIVDRAGDTLTVTRATPDPARLNSHPSR